MELNPVCDSTTFPPPAPPHCHSGSHDPIYMNKSEEESCVISNEGIGFDEELDQSKMDENQDLIAYSDMHGFNNEKEESCVGRVISNEGDNFCENQDQSYNDERQCMILDQGNDEGQAICLSSSLIGIKRENFEEIYELYCNHALEVGFSVRRSTTKYNTKGEVVCKYLVCSCEGIRKERAFSSINIQEGKKRATNITRTNCKASLKAKLNDDGSFEVVDHNTEHNHTLSRREWSHMHRSQRSIGVENAVVIEDMMSCGMKPMDSFRYMAQDAGGEDVLGHTKKDHLNFVNRLRISAIEAGDAQTLIDILYQQGVEDHEFFFRVKLDDEGRLCNDFWRDSMMKEDYAIYGDVVVFDTTYRTNKYNLICAPFVGINNHWKNVMFGCAFIANEKIESFVWLFEVFKKSMEGRCPVTLCTDQDQAIASAIERVFPETRHRLCIWHLYQNALCRLGKLKSNKSFGEVLQKCLTGCTNIEEFEQCWSSMISDYRLKENSWFQRLYSLRERWCNAYNKDFFSAGILSSQRSESTNNTLGFNAKMTTSLNDFYTIFKKTLESWRSNEANDEFQCSRGTTASCLLMTGIVRHAAEVYTNTIFKDFENEFVKSIPTVYTLLSEDRDIKLYNLIHFDCTFHVSYCATGSLVSCSCKRFEECGLLCCHILRILHAHSVNQIPSSYIMKRWTKVAKQDLWDKLKDICEKGAKSVPWRHHIVRRFYSTVLKAQENEDDRLVVEEGLQNITSSLEELAVARQGKDAMQDVEASGSIMNVTDPSRSVTKRRKCRIKGHLQKSKKEEGL